MLPIRVVETVNGRLIRFNRTKPNQGRRRMAKAVLASAWLSNCDQSQGLTRKATPAMTPARLAEVTKPI